MSDYIYAIEAKGVNKTFIKKNKKTLALQDFNIQIKKGSIHGLLGPNGAGKSTFINILGSLVKKDSGNINICNLNIDTATKQSKFKIGIVPQELNIDPFFTPYELLELQAGLYGIKKADRKTNEILENVGLIDQKNSYARTLSGGMRRRLLVAKALVHSPEMLILDEPTFGFGWEQKEVLSKLFRETLTQKHLILISHDMPFFMAHCDQIYDLDNQSIINNKNITSPFRYWFIISLFIISTFVL